MGRVYLSVIVPVYNEAESIRELYTLLKDELDSLEEDYEIIFVDDGSTDGSVDSIRTLHGTDPHVRAIFFERNFGQSAALSAGFDRADGAFIVTLDADLQNNPHDIKALLKNLGEEYDVATGWRHERADPFISKRLPADVSNALLRLTTGVPVHDCGCQMKVFRSRAVKPVVLTKGMHRFIPVILHRQGCRICEVKVSHAARRYGRSKYSFWRIPRALADFIGLILSDRTACRKPGLNVSLEAGYVIREVL